MCILNVFFTGRMLHSHKADVKRQKIIQIIDTDAERKYSLVAVHVADGYEKEGKLTLTVRNV